MSERSRVQIAQLGEREARRRKRKAEIRVRQLPSQPLASAEEDFLVVVGELRKLVDRVPARVLRNLRVHPTRHQTEKGRRELASRRIARRIATRLELLEMCHLPDVDLLGEVPSHRVLERFGRRERPTRQCPARRERLACPLPEQRLETSIPYLENGREDSVGCSFRLRVVNHVDSIPRLSIVRQKRESSDVVVAGAGVAGLSAALAAADAGASVLVLAKASHRSSNS